LCGLRVVEKAGCRLSKDARVFYSILSFLCGISMQLYIEHSSCINLCMAILILAAVCKKKEWKSYRLAAGLFFAGAMIGCAMMGAVTLFSNPQIRQGTIGHTSYFSAGIAALAYGIIRNGVFLLGMYSENAIVLFLLSALQTMQIMKNRAAFSNRERLLYPLCILLPPVVFLFQLVAGFQQWYGKLAIFESAWIILTWLVYISAYVISGIRVLTCSEKREKLRLVGILSGVAAFGILPLMVIWPIGYRCLFHSSIALIGAVLLLADETLNEVGLEKKRFIYVVAASVLAAVVICEGMVFSDIRRMVSIRDAWLEKQVQQGADSVTLFLIPSPYIYEAWNGENEHYAIVDDQQIRLSVLPADVWFRMYYYHYT